MLLYSIWKYYNVSVVSAVHKTCFVAFVFSSQIYMLISCILLKWFKLLKPTEDEKFSIGLKWFLFWINFLGSISAAYFFARHNSHCEPMGKILFILYIFKTNYSKQCQFVWHLLFLYCIIYFFCKCSKKYEQEILSKFNLLKSPNNKFIP